MNAGLNSSTLSGSSSGAGLTPEARDALIRRGRELRSQAVAELVLGLARRVSRRAHGAAGRGPQGQSATGQASRRQAGADPAVDAGAPLLARAESWVGHDGRHDSRSGSRHAA
jgi:hypothetical protein